MSDKGPAPVSDAVTTVDQDGAVRTETALAAARTVLKGGRIATPSDIAAADAARNAPAADDSRGVVQGVLEDTYGPYWRESMSQYSGGASDKGLAYLAAITGGEDRLRHLREWEARTRDSIPAKAGRAAGTVAQLASFELLGPLAAAARGGEVAGEAAAIGARGGELAGMAPETALVAARSAEGSGLSRAAAGAERLAAGGPARAPWYPGMPGTASFRASAGPAMEASEAAAAAENAAGRAIGAMESLEASLPGLRAEAAGADIRAAQAGASSVEQVLASGAVAEGEIEAVGTKMVDAIKAAGDASTEATVAKGMRWLPTHGEMAVGAITGASDQVRNLIHDSVYDENTYTYEDMAAAGALGAAYGLGGTVAGTLAAKGIGAAFASMSRGYGEKEAAKKLLELGMTKSQHAEITRKFGTLEAYVGELERGGLALSEVPAGKLGQAVTDVLETTASVRQEALSASAGAREKINPERLYKLVQDAIAHESSLTAVGAGHADNDTMRTLLKELGTVTQKGQFVPGSAFGGKDVIQKLDAIQSRFGQLERGALGVGGGESGKIAGGFYGKVKRVIRSEMERAISEYNPTLWGQYQAANKTYSAAKTLGKFVDKEALAATREMAGVSSGQAGKALLGAAASTALFGKPWNLLYGEGSRFMVKQLSGALSNLERGMVGMGAAISATAAARESFSRAMSGAGAAASQALAPDSKPISKNMERYTDPKEFAKLLERIQHGKPETAFGRPDSVHASQEKAMMDKLRAKVLSRMPVGPQYAADRKVWESQPSKLDFSSSDLKVLRYIDGAFNPLKVADKVVAGTAGPEHIEALDDLYPALKAEMKSGLVEMLTSAKTDKKIVEMLKKPTVRASLSGFIGAPVGASNDPEFAAKLKAIREEEAKAAEESKKSGGGGGSGPPAGSGANYMTESERIEK